MPTYNNGELLSSVREKINNAIVAIENLVTFKKIKVTGQGDVDATTSGDTLNLEAGANVAITTNPSTKTVVISSTAGGDAPRFEYVQSPASASWTVNHNLGFYPTVHVYTLGRIEVETDYSHTSVNQTIINFNTAQTGIAVFH